jgi:hypothetical protein
MYDIKNIMLGMKDHADSSKMNKLSCLFKELIEESKDPSKYEIDLYILENGYHFNEEMFNKAMEGKDVKWSPDTCNSMMNSHGISFSGELSDVTMYDKAYVMNALYRKYYPLISDPSTAAKFAEKFIKCDYPIPGGRAFAEWMLKCKLEKESAMHV